MFEGNFLKECLICGGRGDGGDGITLRGGFICGYCERKLVNTGCDGLLYHFYVNGLKKIWRCTVA
ncbi:MAG: sigma factor G inhibitor Gin [Peptococcaceae bacterium]|nr:sigma factor G inhibitor Gin [Peptococcaceae bacterium]